MTNLTNASVILPDSILPRATVQLHDGRIVGVSPQVVPDGIDLQGAYLAPGFVDLHVHGGDGFDFMDCTEEAFRGVAICHARHGTTSFTPTSTVATYPEYIKFLELCGHFMTAPTGGARVLGGHLYGPYFHPPARGCHPQLDFLTPNIDQDEALLAFAGRGLHTLTVAPETPGTERLARSAQARGVRLTAGHSFATFPQVEESIRWGVAHTDHLFCAMSDRARLRQVQTYPMRAGVMEATLYFDELTTEVIADGGHLSPELLRLAYKIKGADKLALVTDSMRAVDFPEGEYWFGPQGTGEKIRRIGDVGVTVDGKALASGVMGMDHCVRTMWKATGAPLHDVIRMASLTPARILGLEKDIGSIEIGKRADVLVMDSDLRIQQVYIGGERWLKN